MSHAAKRNSRFEQERDALISEIAVVCLVFFPVLKNTILSALKRDINTNLLF